MFKRVTWLGMGFTLGVGTTVVAARKARHHLDRYKPPALVERVATTTLDKASSLKSQVVDALAEGRSAARAREAQLRLEQRLRTNDDPPGVEADEVGPRR